MSQAAPETGRPSVRERARGRRRAPSSGPLPAVPAVADGRRLDEPALTGLRGVAALMVLLTHVSFQTAYSVNSGAGGRVGSRLEAGVAVFFVLSAFLLYRPWARALLLDEARPRTGRYLWRRAVRVLPAYWATLLLVALVGRPDGLRTLEDWAWQLLLVQNYEGNRFVLGLTQVWSLVTEVAFYLVLPLAAWGLARLARGSVRRRLVTALFVLGVVSALSLLWPLAYQPGNAFGLNPLIAPLWLPQYLGWFAGGMALALLDTVSSRDRPHPLLRAAADAPWACWALAAGVLLWTATPVAGPVLLESRSVPEELARTVGYGLVAVLLVLPAVAARWAPPPRPGTERWQRVRPHDLLRHPLVVHLGAISYPVFLVQLFALDLVYEHAPVERFAGEAPLVLLLSLLVTLVLSELVHRLVEEPARRLAGRGRG